MGPMLVCLSALTSANVDIDNSQTEAIAFKNEISKFRFTGKRFGVNMY